MTAPRRGRWVVTAGLTLLGALSAQATPNFPAALRDELGLTRTPDCSLCHQGVQQAGTVNTPFGAAMRARGLIFYDEDTLRAALTQMREGRVDSDGDGTPDVDELIANTDPNRAPGAAGEVQLEDPSYGCAAAGGAGPLWLGLLLLARVWALRRGSREPSVSSPPAPS